MPQITLSQYIIAGILTAFGLASVIIGSQLGDQADMRIEPQHGTIVVGETFDVSLIVEATTPVNVFGGELNFDPSIVQVESIDYNTSVADLWAEEPWYSNGDGTLNFAGGTTQKGGFLGSDSLLKVKLKTLKPGQAELGMKNVRILKHDGLGTDVTISGTIDAIYAVKENSTSTQKLLEKDIEGPTFRVLTQKPDTDLNKNGRQSVADISIFMADLATQNKRSDFNEDGKVGTADLNILLSN